ncbi:MAG: YebC/PmpR family DNA-binding transcriptional regulator, partial [Candidatus Puniceispirillaceae bacterium]
LEAGADNVESDESSHEVTCAPEDFNTVREAMENAFGAPEESGLIWKPQNTIEVSEAHASTLLKLLDVLDDNDDVQNVSSNFDISDDILATLT